MWSANDKLDKLSLGFAFLSIIVYWNIAFLGLIGIYISIFNSLFWLFYFWKKHIVSQFFIHCSYQAANITFIIHHYNLL